MKPKTQRLAMLVALGLCIFLLIALAVCEAIPITNGNNDLVVSQQATLQLARVEFLVKNVYALAYRPAQHVQAIGELQIQLPAFQNVQVGLMKGDASLGLPDNPSSGVKIALLSAQSDYLAIVTAIKIILSHPDNAPDPEQVNVVAQRERPYISEMYPVIVLLQQEAQTRTIQLLILKMALIGITMIVILLKYLLFTQPVIKKRIEEETEAAARVLALQQAETTAKEHPP